MTKSIIKIIDRLILSQNIYHQLKETIEHKQVNMLCSELLADKVRMLRELSTHAGLDLDNHSISTQAMIKLELGKMQIEINDILTTNKRQETLDFSVIRENELIKLYKDALASDKHDHAMNALLERHILESETTMKKLVLTAEFN